MVAGQRAAENLDRAARPAGTVFRPARALVQARKYMAALMSDLPRKNGWTVAEHAGDATPDRTQRLLNHAVWDNERAAGVVRGFVVEHLAPGAELTVGALDESGHQKQGSATAGVKRQYMGCAGRVANGVNTVYCTYATPGGHSLTGARIWVPAEQLEDPDRRAALGIPEASSSRRNPSWPHRSSPTWSPTRRCPLVRRRRGLRPLPQLRDTSKNRAIGYVLRVGLRRSGRADRGHPRTRRRPRRPAPDRPRAPKRWQTRPVPGSKGRARLRLGVGGHRQTRATSCSSAATTWAAASWPTTTATSRPGGPVTLTTLVRSPACAGRSRKTFEFGKDHFGLDHSQVRLYTAVLRHIVLTMAALAVCAVTAAAEKSRGPATRPPQPPRPATTPRHRADHAHCRRGQTTVQPAHPHRPRHRTSPALGRLETTPPSPRPLASPPHPPPAGSGNMINYKCGCRTSGHTRIGRQRKAQLLVRVLATRRPARARHARTMGGDVDLRVVPANLTRSHP